MDLSHLVYPAWSLLLLTLAAFREEDMCVAPGEYAAFKVLRALSTRPTESRGTATPPDGARSAGGEAAATGSDAPPGSAALPSGSRLPLGEWESLRMWNEMDFVDPPADAGGASPSAAPAVVEEQASPMRRASRRLVRARGRGPAPRPRWNR